MGLRAQSHPHARDEATVYHFSLHSYHHSDKPKFQNPKRETLKNQRKMEEIDQEKKSSSSSKEGDREGLNLLGSPTYKELENGRFKCVETGHELPAKEMESYGQSKKCRLGLIDYALSKKKPPLNMFKQDPLSKSKLICKLTGDTINKSEEHLWKHINGRRFLNKLEQKENGTLEDSREEVNIKEEKQNAKGSKEKKNKKKKKQDKGKDGVEEQEVGEVDMERGSEEVDFWMPPVGSRWDFDDGGDRWDSGSDSGEENDEDAMDEEAAIKTLELSKQTKRMALEIGPSSFASRKKKGKTDSSC